MNLVKNWLPFLIVCKDKVVLDKESDKLLYPDLEQAFLKIISTLPISDSKDFLKQCLISFSTDKLMDCPHLVSTLKTWFLRAIHPPEALAPPCTTTLA
ncbi:hypothetical protein Sjap_016908 [Stephania japonica]|uniref:Uncharacterized protein n=1 Tax=Stephania japonica TaxID=461633 RepID=A0AAP0NIS5_9MAGN